MSILWNLVKGLQVYNIFDVLVIVTGSLSNVTGHLQCSQLWYDIKKCENHTHTYLFFHKKTDPYQTFQGHKTYPWIVVLLFWMDGQTQSLLGQPCGSGNYLSFKYYLVQHRHHNLLNLQISFQIYKYPTKFINGIAFLS